MTRQDGKSSDYIMSLKPEYRIIRHIRHRPHKSIANIILSVLAIEGYDTTVSNIQGSEIENDVKAAKDDPKFYVRVSVWDNKPISDEALDTLGKYLNIEQI